VGSIPRSPTEVVDQTRPLDNRSHPPAPREIAAPADTEVPGEPRPAPGRREATAVDGDTPEQVRARPLRSSRHASQSRLPRHPRKREQPQRLGATEITLHPSVEGQPEPTPRRREVTFSANHTKRLSSPIPTTATHPTSRARLLHPPRRPATARPLPRPPTEVVDRRGLEATEVTPHPRAGVAIPPTPRCRAGHVRLRCMKNPSKRPTIEDPSASTMVPARRSAVRRSAVSPS
jgi:hypothetical protein